MKLQKIKQVKDFLKKNKKIALITLIFLILLFSVLTINSFRNRNVVAVAGGYKITAKDILIEMELSPEYYKHSIYEDPESAIDTYINQILLYKKAKRYSRRYRKEIKPKMKNYYMKTLSQEYVENELVKNITIEDNVIAEYYNNNLNDFIIPERVRIYEIVLPSREKAEEVLRRLSYGESFETIALKESISDSRLQAGDLGWIDVRKLDSEISDMVTKITPGDVLANIVRTHLGFHIIKLVGKTERRILTINEATPSITEMLKIKEKKREVDTLISQEREKGKIKIFKNRVELLKKGLK